MASSRELWLETDDVALIAWLDFCAESCTFDFEKTVYGHLFRTTGKHRSIASVKWKVSQLNAKYTPSSAVEKPSYGWRDMVRSGSVCSTISSYLQFHTHPVCQIPDSTCTDLLTSARSAGQHEAGGR